ncbi:1,4-dihydroxy-2-naphthoate octaprenyltransferase [Beggiatoa alba B18LD]|uniref:1,4-dihydroxy-2-naphthoate octaprenyltransferase n=1 Tax=Beggiatoa alba B18LD TaxID=395493 RepID=I3CFC8_9GAMM|nr:prenyltransferase [Beggiatoa alba]EIJ42321.1 1,4-dihydroxy-2-naphthoate octaprenyltransferase [Beggiatoa alba B18LD]
MIEPNLEIYHGTTWANRVFTGFIATRPAFFTASLAPVCIGLAFTWQQQIFRPLLALLTLLAILCIHAGANVLNDYYDAKNGTDSINQKRIFPFSGGSRFIQNAILSPYETKRLGISLLAFGLMLGLMTVSLTSPILLIFGIVGASLAIFYSMPPCLACRGLGDIVIALCFGILPVTGTVWIQLGTIPPAAGWLGASIGFFAASILWINSIPDIDADNASGKHTLPARLGQERARYGLPILFILGFLCILIAPLPHNCLLALLGFIPASIASIKLWQGQLIPAIPLTLITHSVVGISLILGCLL